MYRVVVDAQVLQLLLQHLSVAVVRQLLQPKKLPDDRLLLFLNHRLVHVANERDVVAVQHLLNVDLCPHLALDHLEVIRGEVDEAARKLLAVLIAQLHRVLHLEVPDDLCDARAEERLVLVFDRADGLLVHPHLAANRHVQDPALAALRRVLDWVEFRADLLDALQHLGDALRLVGVKDHHGDAGGGRDARGRELGGHAAGAPLRALRRCVCVDVAHVVDLVDGLRIRVGLWVGRVEVVHVGHQEQPVGVHQRRHVRRERVVVAKAQLLDRRRVVLVHDRDDAKVEQLPEGVPHVEVLPAHRHVLERHQHLCACEPDRVQEVLPKLH
mmetsp:Transcript_3878/g.11027  ORF Transcript_3878/g.11027 Transcript_3878/m.11027 type:complete len:327 (-) Transcript_3878:712-1692(-)